MDGKKVSDADMIRFAYGERVRMNMVNDTMMSHPMHLHGMWMHLYAGGTLADNPRKHTIAVNPGELLTVDITVDAPGHWAFHCHLLYHLTPACSAPWRSSVRSKGGRRSESPTHSHSHRPSDDVLDGRPGGRANDAAHGKPSLYAHVAARHNHAAAPSGPPLPEDFTLSHCSNTASGTKGVTSSGGTSRAGSATTTTSSGGKPKVPNASLT